MKAAIMAGAALSLLAALPVRGADDVPPPVRGGVYTLEDCLALGVARATSLANAGRDEVIAEARIGQVRAQVFPDLTASGDYTRRDELDRFDLGEGQSVTLGRLDNYSARADASQLLYNGGSVQAALQAAKAYRDMARAETQRVRAALERDIRTGFYDLLVSEAVVAVQEDTVRQLEDLARQAEAKFAQEAVSEFERLSAQVRLANARPVLIDARRRLQVARSAFRNLVRIDEEDFRIEGELTYDAVALTFDGLRAAAYARRPELELGRRRIDLYRSDVRAEQGGYLPEIRLKAAYYGTNPESFASSADSWAWRWEAGVRAEWDLLDGGLRRNRVLQKRMELVKAEADLDELERAIEQEVREAWLDLQHAAEAVGASAATVELAERSLAIARTRYDAGLSTYLEFTDTNLALRQARLERLLALRGHRVALARLRYACGVEDDRPLNEVVP